MEPLRCTKDTKKNLTIECLVTFKVNEFFVLKKQRNENNLKQYEGEDWYEALLHKKALK